MTDEEYWIRRKYENRNLMKELQWASRYPPSGMSNQDKDFIRWLAMTAYDRINELERKRGKWVGYPECLKYMNAYADDHIVCSACEECFSILDNDCERFNFCPNCGADMREES